MLSLRSQKSYERTKEDFGLALEFAQTLKKELDLFLREVIFFGSSSRGTNPIDEIHDRDIDILIILDDVKRVLSNEVIETYRVITEQAASKISRRFHINTLKISALYEYLANGDPIAINILREGKPLLDGGFIKPLQSLLEKGYIRPTRENVWVYFHKAPVTLEGAKWHILQATIDLYWAVFDATHAALLFLDIAPASPDHTKQLLEHTLVTTEKFPKHYVKLLSSLTKLRDDIVKRDLKEVPGHTYDHLAAASKEYVDFVRQWIADKKTAGFGRSAK